MARWNGLSEKTADNFVFLKSAAEREMDDEVTESGDGV